MNKDGEFMSLTLSTFKLFLTLAKTDSNVNRIKVTQKGSDIEILTLYGNFMLTLLSWKYHSTISISKQIMNRLIQNEDSIELRINEEKKMFIQESNPENRIIKDDAEPNNSNVKTIANCRESIESVVKSINNDSHERNDTECIGWCTYGEPEKSCGGGNCTTRIIMEKVSGDKHVTPTLLKSSNSLENDVKQGSITQMKRNKKCKRKDNSKSDDKHIAPSLKKSSNSLENDVKQNKKLKHKDTGKKRNYLRR